VITREGKVHERDTEKPAAQQLSFRCILRLTSISLSLYFCAEYAMKTLLNETVLLPHSFILMGIAFKG